MSDTARRAVRTLLQVLTAAVLGLGVLVAADVLTASQATKAGAVLSVLRERGDGGVERLGGLDRPHPSSSTRTAEAL